MTQSVGDRLAEARDAFQGHEWGRALELFKQADQDAELPPEDIESMGDAAWWAARPDEGIEAFQRAYSAYLAAQNRPRAAYVALTLALLLPIGDRLLRQLRLDLPDLPAHLPLLNSTLTHPTSRRVYRGS